MALANDLGKLIEIEILSRCLYCGAKHEEKIVNGFPAIVCPKLPKRTMELWQGCGLGGRMINIGDEVT